MQTSVYLVVKHTGIYDATGNELVIVYDVKLSQGAAQVIADRYEGATVQKQRADKTTDHVATSRR